MHNLLEFLQRHYHWLLFVVLEAVSLVLLFQYNSYQNSAWLSSANVVAGNIYKWRSSLESYVSMRKANEELTLRNFYMERQLAQLRRLYAEKTDTTSQQEREGLQFLSRYQLIPAKVVSNELDRVDNLITIDRGEADGVKVGMGVACGMGVVGVVYLTTDHYAVVISVLNSHSSRISCAIRGHGYFGVLRWYGGDAGNSSDGMSYKLKVRLSTDFGRLRDVFVFNDPAIEEQLRIIQSARDSLKLNVKE